MRISGLPAAPPPAVDHARSSGRHDPAAPADPFPAPSAAPETPESEPPSGPGKAHGLGAADHSHRSDVAALRQWINHPERRDDLHLPDLPAEHKGNGFARAVAAYEAIMASAGPVAGSDEPAPVTDLPPVASDPAPVVDPAPVTDPVADDTAPVASDLG